MSTLKATNLQHPSAASPAIVLDSAGDSALSGVPTAPTAAAGTNTTQIATTAFAQAAGGLQLITSVAISAAASTSVNNCFSATYDAYRFMFYGTASTANDVYFRLRVGGVDNSTASSYVTQNVQGNSTTASASLLTSDKGIIGYQNTNMAQFSGDIFRPALAVPTFLNSVAGRDPSQYSLVNSSYHNQSTAYDGITIIAGSGNLTGTLKIYGYRN
jgi:hypothetical protein